MFEIELWKWKENFFHCSNSVVNFRQFNGLIRAPFYFVRKNLLSLSLHTSVPRYLSYFHFFGSNLFKCFHRTERTVNCINKSTICETERDASEGLQFSIARGFTFNTVNVEIFIYMLWLFEHFVVLRWSWNSIYIWENAEQKKKRQNTCYAPPLCRMFT